MFNRFLKLILLYLARGHCAFGLQLTILLLCLYVSCTIYWLTKLAVPKILKTCVLHEPLKTGVINDAKKNLVFLVNMDDGWG